MFACIKNGVVTEYGLVARDVINKFPNTSFPIPLENCDLEADFGVVNVLPTDPPTDFNSETHYPINDTPVFTDNAWRQTWQIVPIDEELLNG